MSREEPTRGPCASSNLSDQETCFRGTPRKPGAQQPDGFQSLSALVSLCVLTLFQPLPLILPCEGTGPGGPQALFQLPAFPELRCVCNRSSLSWNAS